MTSEKKEKLERVLNKLGDAHARRYSDQQLYQKALNGLLVILEELVEMQRVEDPNKPNYKALNVL